MKRTKIVTFLIGFALGCGINTWLVLNGHLLILAVITLIFLPPYLAYLALKLTGTLKG